MEQKLSVKETQAISLTILKLVAKICENLNLRYFLMYGTLIGAVRHQGYIPWDDDTDIMMPRNDYDLLLDYLEKHPEQINGYSVFNHDVETKYPYMITRISDNSTRIRMENERDYGLGVFVDIYPFDGLGNDENSVRRYALKGDRLSSFCYQATRKHLAVETTTSNVRKVLKVAVFIAAKILGKDFFQKKLAGLADKISFDSANYVGCVVWLSGGMKDVFPRKWFDDYSMLQFEDQEFRVPGEYRQLLEQVYGDYMKLPPKSKRVGHHDYQAYRK